jgi:hypothetical protein
MNSYSGIENEIAYRRGADQALALAVEIVEGATSIEDARSTMASAKSLASKYRLATNRSPASKDRCFLHWLSARLPGVRLPWRPHLGRNLVGSS